MKTLFLLLLFLKLWHDFEMFQYQCLAMFWKEGNGLFNDALNTFYLRLYGVRHMVKIAREETHCRRMGYSFRLTARVLLYAPSHRQDNTYHCLMVRWVIRSILHGVDPLSYCSFQPVLHDWCNKGCGMYNPVYGMVHIKEHLLLMRRQQVSSHYLSGPLPYA